MQRPPNQGRRPTKPPARKPAKRVRVHPRFFIFVLLLVVIALLMLLALQQPRSARTGSALVQENIIGSQFQGEAVIVRDETLTDAESITRIDFIAEEGAHVYKGNKLCQVYSAGYNQTEVNRLETARERIKEYHRTTVMNNYNDALLKQVDDAIDDLAMGARLLVQGLGQGNLVNLENQLVGQLAARQRRLKEKYPDDQQLTTLYKEETSQLRKIDSWTTTYVAQQEGIVSFYTDGYELSVNAQTYENISPQQARQVLNGQKLEIDTISRGRQPIFRTVKDNVWYVLLLSNEKSWNPIVGQTYKMQLEGFEKYLVNAVVQSFTRSGSELLVRMRIDGDVRPVLNIRTCRVVVGEFVDGLSVPIAALRYHEDMIGVIVENELTGQVFVPVLVLSQDTRTAFVRPMIAGSLNSGQKILTYEQ